MSKNISLNSKVVRFLKNNPDQKYTAREIAEWIVETHPKESAEKQQRSEVINDDASLLQQYAAEIGARRFAIQDRCVNIKTTEGRPRKYYYTEQSDADEVQECEEKNNSVQNFSEDKFSEYDLYKVLANTYKPKMVCM